MFSACSMMSVYYDFPFSCPFCIFVKNKKQKQKTARRREAVRRSPARRERCSTSDQLQLLLDSRLLCIMFSTCSIQRIVFDLLLTEGEPDHMQCFRCNRQESRSQEIHGMTKQTREEVTFEELPALSCGHVEVLWLVLESRREKICLWRGGGKQRLVHFFFSAAFIHSCVKDSCRAWHPPASPAKG